VVLSTAVPSTPDSLPGTLQIIEDSSDGTGTTFRWQRFAKGGEAGAEPGDGFANVDNLAFDSQGNVWGVTDMSTEAHNGFATGVATNSTNIDHTVIGAVVEGATSDLNVQLLPSLGFGNNWLFFIPTSGPDAGAVYLCLWPTLRDDRANFCGDTLIISVQHPGEQCPFNPRSPLIEILRC